MNKQTKKTLIFLLAIIYLFGNMMSVSAGVVDIVLNPGTDIYSMKYVPLPPGYIIVGCLYAYNPTVGDVITKSYMGDAWVNTGWVKALVPEGYVPFWIRSNYGTYDIYIYNPSTGSIKYRSHNSTGWGSNSSIGDCKVPDGYMMVSCYAGVYAFNVNTRSFVEREFGRTTWKDSTMSNYNGLPDGYIPVMDGYGQMKIGYKPNAAPTIITTSPASNSVYSSVAGFNTINLKGTVNDVDIGNILTTKFNIDGGTTQTVAGTIVTSGAFANTAIMVNSLNEGNHSLIVWAEDNDDGISAKTTIPFRIDKSGPMIGNINISTFDKSISISGSATDGSNLHAVPYQYQIGSNPVSGWITNSSYSFNTLIPNTYYSIKFEAKDAVGNISQITKYVYTKASTPTLTISNIASNKLNLTTNEANPATTQYQIQVNNSQYVTPEGTLTSSPVFLTLPTKSIEIKGLTPETTYTFKAKAINTEGVETAWSSPISGTTLVAPPAAPTNIISTATNNSITVVWDPVAGCTGYQIEADGRLVDIGTYNSYIHTNLVQFTQHTYRVRAKNAGGFGAWSEQISKYTQQDNPNTPFNIDAAANNTSIIVTWKPIPGATAYDIEVDGMVVNNYSSTNYVHSGLIPGTMHAYRVRSINSTGKSEWSNEILVSTQPESPDAPSNVTTQTNGDRITVTWNPVQGATYEIEVDGTIRDNGTSSTFAHSGLASGSTHTYRVRTKRSGSISDWSAYVTATLPRAEFGIPQNIKSEASDTTITLSWNPVVDAIGYDVEVDGVITDNSIETNCLFSSLTPNTQHLYRVRARGTEKVSQWSEYKAVMTYALPTPTNLMAIASGDTVIITWDGVAGAESYDLDIDGQIIQNITSSPYVHPGLDMNNQHIYKVRVKNVTGFSAWSKPFSQLPPNGGVNAPTGVMAKSLTNSIQLMWKPMPDAASYNIEIDGAVIQGITDTSYIHTGLEPGKQHSYRISAVINGVQGDWSNASVVTTLPVAPPIPTSVTASSTTSSILVSWDKITEATEYELEMDGTVVSTGTGTSYLHNNLAPESSHTYRVRSRNVSDWSLWSEALTIETKSSVQSYEIQSTTGQVFSLVLTANDVTDPSKYTYTITYNVEELEVLDLCAGTPRTDMAVGSVIGTDIQIVQYAPGTIVFKKLGTSAGPTWTGQINSIKFKSKTDHTTQVIYSFE